MKFRFPLAEALAQIGHGGVLVKGASGDGLAFDAAVELEVEMPGGQTVKIAGKVLQVLAGLGVAVAVDPAAVEQLRAPAPAEKKETSKAEKIQMALHGNREQRNAILRDPDRSLHPYVLKNPQIAADDILAIVKSNATGPDLFKQIAQRREWFQRSDIAVALARNPKTPGDVAVRALEFVPAETLRQLAKGGAPPHVVTAARKKIVGA